MKPISKFVLNKAFSDISNLEKAIACLDEESQDRFIEILIGADTDISVLHRKIKRNGVIYTIKSANYLKDEIIATYDGTDIIYFTNQDDADEFAKSGNYNYNNSSYEANETCTIKGEYPIKRESWFSYYTWMNSEVVKE